jgi:serine/threonine-protein kinase
MFTLLTGEYVHIADTVNEALALAITARARPIATIRPDLPREVATLIDRALSYEQDLRFSNAAAMQQELRVAYLALREPPRSETEQPATGSTSYAVPALTLPSSTLGDIPSSAVPSSPRQRQTTNRGLGATLLGTFARSPRYVAFGLAIAVALVVATTTYFKLRRLAEAETVPVAQTIANSTAMAPSSPLASSSQASLSATPVPVLEINDLPAAPAAESVQEKAPTTNRRAGASSNAAPRPGTSPAAAKVSPKPFDPFAVRE